jgi:hypothetical protein
MYRIPRICLVFVLSFVLLAATVPAAHARTLAKPQSSNSIIGSWIEATLSWTTGFGIGTSQATPAPRKPRVKTDSTGSLGGALGTIIGIHPMCGSGVDPQGCPGTGG